MEVGPLRFADKVVLVTGASRGIGQVTAMAFAREGARVALLGIDGEEGEAATEECGAAGPGALWLEARVEQEAEVKAAIGQVKKKWGRLDVLVNNAGIHALGDAVSTTREAWDQMMAVNVTGPFLCVKYALPAMLEQGSGCIVNVASEAGLVGIPGQIAYNVSKGALIAMTRSLAVDLAAKGVRANCVCPGTTRTPLVEALIARSPDPDGMLRKLEGMRPQNRLGRPEEIAAAILLLAADEAAYATGAVLSIDGGYTAQ
jgi:NAD(P)-dependent dehydrogenase (short-subunit alcohol dehydrogenase family)